MPFAFELLPMGDAGVLVALADSRDVFTAYRRLAAARDAPDRRPAAAKVLDGRAEPGSHHAQRLHVRTNLTRSPGARSAGGFRSASKRTMSVVPIRFQPPGVAAG